MTPGGVSGLAAGAVLPAVPDDWPRRVDRPAAARPSRLRKARRDHSRRGGQSGVEVGRKDMPVTYSRDRARCKFSQPGTTPPQAPGYRFSSINPTRFPSGSRTKPIQSSWSGIFAVI